MATMNLADPELEMVDPTPNIYSLFVHFDELFFWSKLLGRALVRWSKRMYSSAGVCSYEGRGGLCDIALSEPLLKLRPRKDFVETLLHEMIHAYLFITNRDNDRDGHGPNFQAHMHRINRAAGLNISIYHDFHDEVRLYQKHWWRCNGICQKMKPYFGIVRRPMNRAPGPSDNWWQTHQRMCGGTFIKIKEPEMPQKVKKTDKRINADIIKYINNNSNIASKNVNKGVNKENKTNTSTNIKKTGTPAAIKSLEVKSLVDISRKRTNSATVTETVRNVWINKQLPTVPGATVKDLEKSSNESSLKKHKNNSDQTNSPPSKVRKIDDYFKSTASSILKDIYGEEFVISQSSNSTKLKAVTQGESVKMPPVNVFVNCPSCNTKVYSNDINRHLDECLNKDIIKKLRQDSPQTTAVSNPVVSRRKSQGHRDLQIKPEIKPKIEIKTEFDDKSKLKSIVGNIQTIPPYRFNTNHVKSKNIERLIKIEKEEPEVVTGPLNNVKPTTSKTCPTQTCAFCGIKFDIPTELHQNICLGFFDTDTTIPEEGLSDLDTVVIEDEFKPIKINTELGTSKEVDDFVQKCPCCGDKIVKPIDEHLDECLGFFDNNTTVTKEGTSVVETIVIDDDENDIFDESQTFNETGTKTPCPCCLKMIEIAEMNDHLDVCLSTSLC